MCNAIANNKSDSILTRFCSRLLSPSTLPALIERATSDGGIGRIALRWIKTWAAPPRSLLTTSLTRPLILQREYSSGVAPQSAPPQTQHPAPPRRATAR